MILVLSEILYSKDVNMIQSHIQDIRSFFRPIPKIEKTESIESSRLSAVQEASSPPDDDDDGFFVAAPHIVNSPPKLSPIPLIEGMSIHFSRNLWIIIHELQEL